MPQKRDPATGRYLPNGGAYEEKRRHGYYPRISCGPCRGQRLHRVKAAIEEGRELRPTEDVHHRGERWQFARQHLQVMSHSAHSSLTWHERQRMQQEDDFLRKQWEEVYCAGFDAEYATCGVGATDEVPF